jgi:hypothetical protein
MPKLLCPQGKSSWYLLDRRLSGTQIPSELMTIIIILSAILYRPTYATNTSEKFAGLLRN